MPWLVCLHWPMLIRRWPSGLPEGLGQPEGGRSPGGTAPSRGGGHDEGSAITSQAGQNMSEWAKQQACRKIALEAEVSIEPGFDRFLIAKSDSRSAEREQRGNQRVTQGLAAVTEVIALGPMGGEQFRHSLVGGALHLRMTTARSRSHALCLAIFQPTARPSASHASPALPGNWFRAPGRRRRTR